MQHAWSRYTVKPSCKENEASCSRSRWRGLDHILGFRVGRIGIADCVCSEPSVSLLGNSCALGCGPKFDVAVEFMSLPSAAISHFSAVCLGLGFPFCAASGTNPSFSSSSAKYGYNGDEALRCEKLKLYTPPKEHTKPDRKKTLRPERLRERGRERQTQGVSEV